MEKEFVTYEIALALKELGFDEPCFAWFISEGYGLEFGKVIQSDLIKDGVVASTYSGAFRWFRKKYDLHVQIRKENYFTRSKYEYFHFDISEGEKNDITKQEYLYDDILDECSQDIPGNYLNDEKFSNLIFEKGFAFKSYEETELACLKKLIEIVKYK
jgi:hypothetical protein